MLQILGPPLKQDLDGPLVKTDAWRSKENAQDKKARACS